MSPSKAVAVHEPTADEINTPIGFEEAIANSGFSEAESVVIVNPYEVLNKDKDALLNKPFFIRNTRFAVDKTTGAEYVVLYVVTQDNKMYVVTDGSTGIYKQMQKIVDDYDRTHSFLIANGLRKSDYIHEASGQPATTYYLA